MLCGAGLLLLALLAAGWGLGREYAAGASAQRALAQLQAQTGPAKGAAGGDFSSAGESAAGGELASIGEGRAGEDFPSPEEGAAGGGSPYADGSAAAEGSAQSEEGPYWGILRLPALGLELPVARQCSPRQLALCPCRYCGAPDAGLVIAGHDFRRHFGGLARLEPGDAAILVDAQGREYCYHMALSQVLPPDGGALLAQEDWPLTLLTCTRGGTARLAVRFA